MVTSHSLSLTSPWGKKVICVLIVAQLVLIAVVYYSRVTLWSALDEKVVSTDGSNVITVTESAFLNSTLPLDIRNSPVKIGPTADEHNQPATVAAKADIHTEEKLIDEHTKTSNRTKIAIGLGITTRGLHDLNGETMKFKMPFFRSLLSSFCKTCSGGYDYNFFLAYDYNDGYMSVSKFLVDFAEQFSQFVESNCPPTSWYSMHFVRCNHTRKPAWAQNDAMMEAYLSGMEYFYRINDDTIMTTAGWTTSFIKTLNDMSPPRVGVVGPKHQGGNENILTYDFVHKTHVEIHGFYYPRYFTDWYADKWITDVYQPGRSVKLSSVLLKHTMETGQRYKNIVLSTNEVRNQVMKDQQTVTRYVTSKESHLTRADPRKVIAMSVYSLSPDLLWGIIRNAQLISVMYPGWLLRVYVEDKTSPNRHLHVPQRILDILVSLGAQVVYTNTQDIPLAAASYLVADDPTIDVFLIRNPQARLNVREAASVADWMKKSSETTCVHSIKDHQTQKDQDIVDGQWGATSKCLKEVLGKVSIKTLLSDFKSHSRSVNDMKSFAQDFLNQVLWNRIKDHVLCHNSISCTEKAAGTVLPFPFVSKERIFVGQLFQAYEVPVPQDGSSSVLTRNSQCENPSR